MIGVLTHRQFEENDTECPYIGRVGVVLIVHSFWTHVEHSAYKCVCDGIGLAQLLRDSEISQLELPRGVQEDVLWLNVSV